MRRDLGGRVVLVTGASRGIGRRVAGRLARIGARVAAVARSADELAKAAGEIRAAGGTCEPFPADLTDPAARSAVTAAVAERFGRVDVLVNAAGVASFGEFGTGTPDILRRVAEVNFFAAAEMIRACHPHLVASSVAGPASWRPAVVNVASICGRCGIPGLSEHCGSKHALVGLTEALRGEFERYGIDVLLVLPGLVRSDDLSRHLLRNDGPIYLDFDGAQPPDEVADAVVRSLQRNRAEAAVGFVSWWVWFGKRFFPRVPRWVMHRKARNGANRRPRAEGAGPPVPPIGSV